MIRTAFALILVSLIVSRSQAGQQPNVVVILADDIGYGDLGSYREMLHTGPEPFQTTVPTPNLDKLARQGMKFTDAHSPAALCAASRFSIMTGQNPIRNGRQGGTWRLRESSAFTANGTQHDTLGDIMQSAGYRTSMFGKFSTGGEMYRADGSVTSQYSQADFSRAIGDGLGAHGFDYSYGLHSGIQNAPYAYFENDKFAPIDPSKPADNSSMRNWDVGVYANADGTNSEIRKGGLGDVDWDSSQVGDQLSRKAVDFIDSHVQQNRANGEETPLFMFYASQSIHVPHTPPNTLDGNPVRGTSLNEKTDMIVELDMQVGRILDKLEAEGMADDTLIIFTSDNGGLGSSPEERAVGHNPSGPLLKKKGSPYEGGHRVPFIAKWGDGTDEGSYIEPGSTSDQFVVSKDLAASLYDLTRQNMPSDQSRDSTTMLPILFGEDEPIRSFSILQGNQFVLRMDDEEGDWVLLLDRKNGTLEPFELYNLVEDLGQKNDLFNDPDQQARIEIMEQLFLQHNNQNDPRETAVFNVADATPIPLLGSDGDFDNDGDVDGADFLAWQRNGGTDQQLTIWRDNFVGNNSSSLVSQVPEPSSLVLLTLFALGGSLRCQRSA